MLLHAMYARQAKPANFIDMSLNLTSRIASGKELLKVDTSIMQEHTLINN